MTPPIFDFTVDASIAEWTVPASVWVANTAPMLRERQLTIHGLATSSFVFDAAGRLLVVQRANHDTLPGRWEVPGGAVDADDPTVLYGAARELWEEAGLVARRFCRLVTGEPPAAEEDPHLRPLYSYIYHSRRRTRCFCRCAFLVDVQSDRDVRLEPDEHQAFTWASEDDIRHQTMGPVATDDMHLLMLEAFRLRRELNQSISPHTTP